MFYKIFLLVFFFIILQTLCSCTECFDFQCFDGGVKRQKNCIKCTNVSVISEKEWYLNIEQLIYISKKLKKYSLVRKYENRRNDGMYCCSTVKLKNSCSLILSPGSRDGITHYGMSCTASDLWSVNQCESKYLDARCCKDNHCNSPNIKEMQYLMEIVKADPLFTKDNDNDKYKYLMITLVCITSVSLFVLTVFCAVKFIKSVHSKRHSTPESSQNRSFYKKMHCFENFFNSIRKSEKRKKPFENNTLTSFSDSTIQRNDSFNYLSCSGSGAGKPLMTNRSAATDISLVCVIGDGRFGTVWLGKWNGDNVAVKIFSTRDERSWDREKQMYQKNILRHSNVLGYIATDSRDNGMSTELWLVTDYHENGSLFDYLRTHIVSVEQAVKMVRSITNGLAYLHTEISGTEFRPGIAHRDLKSRNILVKSCGECCIGDLGLAVRLNEDCSALDTNRVGTRRYMAPEILLDKIVISDLYHNSGLEAFKKADIYSYSLVLWEILRRCECVSLGIESCPYEMPYQNLVSGDPSIDEMREVVCVKKLRPPMSICWHNVHPIMEISESIQESWFELPASRLTIMRLKKIMSSVWNEVLTLKRTIVDLSTTTTTTINNNNNNDVVTTKYQVIINNDHNQSTELPPSSVTSNDIPNIVIRTADNVLLTDNYSSSNNFSINTS